MTLTLSHEERDGLAPEDSGKRSRRRKRGDGRAALGFLSPTVAGFAIFTLLPVVGSLVMAFFQWPIFGEPAFNGLANFERLFSTDPVFMRVVINTVLFVALYVPLNIIVSLGLAVWISPKIKGRRLYRVLFFLPAVTPMVANAVVWQLMFVPKGIIDQFWQWALGTSAPNFLGSATWAMPAIVLMSVWQGFGYNMIVFSAGLDAIPSDLNEAAEIDGAGPFRRFWSITLPMLSPSIFFAVTMTVISSFQVFAQPYILTGGGPGVATETLVMYLYRTGFELYELGAASAVAWVLFVVIMGFTALIFAGQKRWVHYGN